MGLSSNEPGGPQRALRWGVLSTADIARTKVIPAFKKTPRAELVAIASRDGERARRVAAELGFDRHHDSYEALLADPDVEAVYIPLPNHMHLEWTIRAVRAGKHVLCEKPLAMTAHDAQRMVDAAAATGVTLMEAFMYRLHPSWVAVREIVESGRIGRLMAVQSWFSYYNDDPANIRNIRVAGGGALYDIGCYCINLSRLLFGAEPVAVKGSILREPQLGVDILASAILEFETGVATFTCSTRTETDQRVHVYGTAGRVSVGIPFNIPPDRPTEVYVTAGGDAPVAPNTQTMRFDTADPYTVEAETFAAVALDGLAPPFPPEDAVANMRVLEQIVASAEGDAA
jgi:predicted dehydrogenase